MGMIHPTETPRFSMEQSLRRPGLFPSARRRHDPPRALARMSDNSGPASTAIRSRSAVDQTLGPLSGKIETMSSRFDSFFEEHRLSR
jgi:hypothetical protein